MVEHGVADIVCHYCTIDSTENILSTVAMHQTASHAIKYPKGEHLPGAKTKGKRRLHEY